MVVSMTNTAVTSNGAGGIQLVDCKQATITGEAELACLRMLGIRA